MFNPAYEKGPSFDRARSQIATPFQYIDIPLDVAASNQIVNIAGDFLYVDAVSTGVVTLELNNQYSDQSAPFYAQPGFGLAALFKQLKLSWPAQVGKFVRLMYSTGDRVVPTNSTSINGIVNTVDGGLTRTLNGEAMLGVSAMGAVAGQYAHAQLWNPAASSKTLFVEQVEFSSATAQSYVMGNFGAAYANAMAATYYGSKLLPAAVGQGVCRFQTNAAVQIDKTLAGFVTAANVVTERKFAEPLAVPPGQGFVVIAQTVNTTLNCNFEWFEQ